MKGGNQAAMKYVAVSAFASFAWLGYYGFAAVALILFLLVGELYSSLIRSGTKQNSLCAFDEP
jgi:hypothetical protein